MRMMNHGSIDRDRSSTDVYNRMVWDHWDSNWVDGDRRVDRVVEAEEKLNEVRVEVYEAWVWRAHKVFMAQPQIFMHGVHCNACIMLCNICLLFGMQFNRSNDDYDMHTDRIFFLCQLQRRKRILQRGGRVTQTKLQIVSAAVTKTYVETATDDTGCFMFVFDKTSGADGMVTISKNCTVEDALLMIHNVAKMFEIGIDVSTTADPLDLIYG